MRISSRNNGLITETAKLKDKKHRDSSGLFLLHGKKLVREAVLCGIELTYVFATEKNAPFADSVCASCPGCEAVTVTGPVFEKLTDEKSPEGVCAAAKIPVRGVAAPDGFVLICDSVSDPGNLGTILRSARAFGVKTVYLSSGCADLWSAKVLRGAMGAAFAPGVVSGADTDHVIRGLRSAGYKVYAAALHTDSVPLSRADLSGRCAVVVGNEGHGLPEDTVSLCDAAISIEMEPECESLNAAVAASVIMYRAYRGG